MGTCVSDEAEDRQRKVRGSHRIPQPWGHTKLLDKKMSQRVMWATLESKGILRHKEGKSVTQQSCGHRVTCGCLRGHRDPYTERTGNCFLGRTEHPARSDPRDIQRFCESRDFAAKGLRARALESDYWDLNPSSTTY